MQINLRRQSLTPHREKKKVAGSIPGLRPLYSCVSMTVFSHNKSDLSKMSTKYAVCSFFHWMEWSAYDSRARLDQCVRVCVRLSVWLPVFLGVWVCVHMHVPIWWNLWLRLTTLNSFVPKTTPAVVVIHMANRGRPLFEEKQNMSFNQSIIITVGSDLHWM